MPDRTSGLSEVQLNDALESYDAAGSVDALRLLANEDQRFMSFSVQQKLRYKYGIGLETADIPLEDKSFFKKKWSIFIEFLHERLFGLDIRAAREEEATEAPRAGGHMSVPLIDQARNRAELQMALVGQLWDAGHVHPLSSDEHAEEAPNKTIFPLPLLVPRVSAWECAQSLLVHSLPAEAASLQALIAEAQERDSFLVESASTLSSCVLIICMQCSARFSHLHCFYVEASAATDRWEFLNMQRDPVCPQCGSHIIAPISTLAVEELDPVHPLLAASTLVTLPDALVARMPPLSRYTPEGAIPLSERIAELYRLCHEKRPRALKQTQAMAVFITYSQDEFVQKLIELSADAASQRSSATAPHTEVTGRVFVQNVVDRVTSGLMPLDRALDWATEFAKTNPEIDFPRILSAYGADLQQRFTSLAVMQVLAEVRGASPSILAYYAANLARLYAQQGAQGLARIQGNKLRVLRAQITDIKEDVLLDPVIIEWEAAELEEDGRIVEAIAVFKAHLNLLKDRKRPSIETIRDLNEYDNYTRIETQIALLVRKLEGGELEALLRLQSVMKDVAYSLDCIPRIRLAGSKVEQDDLTYILEPALRDRLGGSKANLGRIYRELSEATVRKPLAGLVLEADWSVSTLVAWLFEGSSQAQELPANLRLHIAAVAEALAFDPECTYIAAPMKLMKKAIAFYEEALAISERVGGFRFAAIQSLALAEMLLEMDPADPRSTEHLKKADEFSRRSGAQDVLTAVLEQLVRIFIQRNDATAAHAYSKEGVKLLLQRRMAAGTSQLRDSLGKDLLRFSLRAAELSLILEDAPGVLEALENAKSSLFSVELGREVLRLEGLVDGEGDLARLKSLESHWDSLQESSLSEPGRAFESRTEDLDTVSKEITDLKEELRLRHPRFQQWCRWATVDPLQADDVRRELSKTYGIAVCLGFFVTNQAIYWYSITKSSSAAGKIELGDEGMQRLAAEIDAMQQDLAYGLIRRSKLRAGYIGGVLAEALSCIVPQPNLQIVLSAHGVLLSIPWSFIPVNGQNLLALGTIYSLPGLGLIEPLRRQVRPTGSEKILIIADPLEGTPGALPGALEEANAIKTAFAETATKLSGAMATPEALILLAPSHQILHIGCHAEFNASSLEAGSLFLSDGSDPPRAVRFSCSQVADQLHLNQTMLVNVAACSGGRLRSKNQTEVDGFSSSFLLAGASTVLASLWPLHDTAASTFSVRFYQELQRLPEPGSALRATQLACEGGSLGELLKSPFHWAGYTLVGMPWAKGPDFPRYEQV